MLLKNDKSDILMPFNSFVETHQAQLESLKIPTIFWETLYNKLTNEIFDAGNVFQLAICEEDDSKFPTKHLFVSTPDGMRSTDEQHIYLIDHAWTYQANQAKQYLHEIPRLLQRMCDLMGYQTEEKNEENNDQKIEFVLKEMWKYNNTFSVHLDHQQLSIWYIMDEVGCSISHSDEPNFRCVCFMYLPQEICYSLIFPIKDLNFQDMVTRDYIAGQTEDLQLRKALLLPWINSNFDSAKFDQDEPEEAFFLSSRIAESIPHHIDENLCFKTLCSKAKIKVFSQYDILKDYLTDNRFEITDDKSQADILWLTSHFKNFKEFSEQSPEVYVNQFPFESVLTVKDLFSIICRRKSGDKPYDPDTLETFPSWFPTTYNLNTELIQFIAYFKKREKLGLNNLWICKPWNLARGMDMHITENLFHILRLPSTGPKIAQKYIVNPALYQRPEIGKVKFDIRYIVLLKSIKPLCVYAYANFFLRFSNKQFALNNYDDYEQHFTVMNYNDNTKLFHLKCADFILEWDKQYADYSWKSYVEPKILNSLKEMFEAAISAPPPKGIAESHQSRAMYAVDLILEWINDEIQPVILEVNFAPDCERACQYYQDFFNEVFQCLFFNNNNPELFHDLTIF